MGGDDALGIAGQSMFVETPSRVIPPDVDPSIVDLSGYSERVLGSAPLLSSRIVVEPSGIAWGHDSEGPAPFLRLCFDPSGRNPRARLDLSREEAAGLLSKIDEARERGAPVVDASGGLDFLVFEHLWWQELSTAPGCPRGGSPAHTIFSRFASLQFTSREYSSCRSLLVCASWADTFSEVAFPRSDAAVRAATSASTRGSFAPDSAAK